LAETALFLRDVSVLPKIVVRPPEELPENGAPAVSGSRTLTVRNLSIEFGGVHAVEDVSFEVQPGEIVAIIGPNGAG
jgi:ATPase subunit of ABC transporter with duplicated ATPase domains